MPFINAATVHSMLNGCVRHHIEAGKDVFYRLKNHSGICWRMVLWLFATKFKALTEQEGEPGRSPRCMVFDDTLLEKTGKKIEKVSRMWDHVSHRFVLGFKLLLLGYWEGTSFIPLDFSLHRERGKNKEKPFGLTKKEFKKQYKKGRERGGFANERCREADQSKISCAVKMFRRAIAQGFKVDYVLMDSWFTCEELISAVLGVKNQATHLIGMYKTVTAKFLFQEEMYTYKQILNLAGKAKRCRRLGFYYKKVEVGFKGKVISLFFSKQGKNGKWKVFLSADTRLSFTRMIEIYQTRWTIEVFFKEAKGLLGLGKCQSNDFAAQVADATITMVQHILVTLRYRYEEYESINGLFARIKESATRQRLDQRLWGLFLELLQIIRMIFEDIDEQQVLERILNDEQAYGRIARLLERPDTVNAVA
jgi:predicted nucleic acid-binding Zn finger protein